SSGSFAQSRPVPTATPVKPPAVVPVKEIVDRGTVSGQRYTNARLGFSITFPEKWRVRESGFEEDMLKQGFDIRLKAPDNLSAAEKARLNESLRRVEVLVTASRSLPGTADNAIMRVSAEDLKTMPQVKDAVDYFDAMRSTFKTMRLPPDLKYSETQAEQLD